MRIATYNQMFALDGTKPHSHILSYLSVNFRLNHDKIYSKASLDRTADVISGSKAEIVGLCEVLGGQKEDFKHKLMLMGYPYVSFANGAKKKYSNIYVMVAIASKIKCNQIKVEGFPIENKFYGGGGMIHCYVPDYKCHIIQVHLSIPTKRRLYNEQIHFIQNYIKNLKGRVVLMGDFNLNYSKLKFFFKNMELASSEIESCSNTRVLRHFKSDDIDHILVKGFKVKRSGALEGYSDHKMIYSDLK